MVSYALLWTICLPIFIPVSAENVSLFFDVVYMKCDTFVGRSCSLRPEDIGNQARVLLVEFIRQRLISAGLEAAEDLLISPDTLPGAS